jgi:hypothetical protein
MPARANSSKVSISKIIRAKWVGGVAQALECLLCNCKVLSSNPSPTDPPPQNFKKQLSMGHVFQAIF